MARIFGYDSSENLIHAMTDLTQHLHEEANQWTVLLQQHKNQGFIKISEFQFYRRDGIIQWGSANTRALKDAMGILT